MASDLSNPLLFSNFFFLLLHLLSTLPETCSTMVCKPGEPRIKYPFSLQPHERCVCPGFHLSCNGQNRTILSLPLSGEFTVDSINYAQRLIGIGDPAGCLPKRLQDFTTSRSIWKVVHSTEFTFFKCAVESMALRMFTRVPCLDGHNHSFVVIATQDPGAHMIKIWKKLGCNSSHSVSIPTVDNSLNQYGVTFPSSIVLTWDDSSDCTDCAAPEGTITLSPPPHGSLKDDDTTDRRVIPVVGVIGLMFVLSSITLTLRFRCLAQEDQTYPSSLPDEAQALIDMPGMDTLVIESFPMTRVGDAGGLMPGDDSCSICLSEYRPKEVLRTLPECKHGFHVHCIDPWLKRNACCPLCRNDQLYVKLPTIF